METSNTWWVHIVAHKRPVTYMWRMDERFSQKKKPRWDLQGSKVTHWNWTLSSSFFKSCNLPCNSRYEPLRCDASKNINKDTRQKRLRCRGNWWDWLLSQPFKTDPFARRRHGERAGFIKSSACRKNTHLLNKRSWLVRSLRPCLSA